MLAQGWITHPQMRLALEAQRVTRTGRFGDWLATECKVDREWITRGLSIQLRRPVLSAGTIENAKLAAIAPRSLMRDLDLVPIRWASPQVLELASAQAIPTIVIGSIERMLGCKVEVGLLNDAVMEEARQQLERGDVQPERCERVRSSADAIERIVQVIERRHPREARLCATPSLQWLRLSSGEAKEGRNRNGPGNFQDFVYCQEVS